MLGFIKWFQELRGALGCAYFMNPIDSKVVFQDVPDDLGLHTVKYTVHCSLPLTNLNQYCLLWDLPLDFPVGNAHK